MAFLTAKGIARTGIALLTRTLVLPMTATRIPGEEFAGSNGDTITVRVPVPSTARTQASAGSSITYDDLDETPVDVTLAHLYHATKVTDESMSLVKLNQSNRAVMDFFTDPVAVSTYNGQDNDLGSGGVLIMPGSNNVVFGGKEGHLYQANSNAMGGQTSTPVQNFGHPGTHIHSAPCFMNVPLTGANPLSGPTVYFWPQEDHLQAYKLNTTTGLFEQTAQHYGEVWFDLGGRRAMSRSTTAESVLETIYSLAGLAPPEEDGAIFRGHPLAVPPKRAAAVFYGIWPALVVAGGVFLRRRHA